MNNNPFEPTRQGTYGPNDPTYILPPQPCNSSGSQMPLYQQHDSYATSLPGQLPTSYIPPPRKDRKKTSRLFVFLAIIAIVVVAAGSASWFLMRTGLGTTPSPPVAKGQVSFLDSQEKAPGGTNALKITVSNLPNPPDGSEYNAWLTDTSNEQILSLGSLNKSSPTTFVLSYPNSSLQLQTNLVGTGNKIEVTQEQGKVTVPSGKVILSTTFPPLAFVHIRHLLFKFPAAPNDIGLLSGLVNETQKVNALSLMLQNTVTSSNTVSVACIAQAIINVIEGNKGTNFHPLAANCVGDATIGDGFGILGNGKDGGYIPFAASHASLAASQPDSTDTIRLYAKDVAASTDSINRVMTKIDNDALQLLTHSATTALVSEMVSLSDHAYHGFDQNGDGKIEPVVGEAGALTAYTSGQHMATLTLS